MNVNILSSLNKFVLCSFKVVYLGTPKEGLNEVVINFHFTRGYSPPLIIQ